jgi:hypothetical protein
MSTDGSLEKIMKTSVFTEKAVVPGQSQLAEALGSTARVWADLQDHLEAEYGPLVGEWKFYSTKSGWVHKTLRKKRNLFFFTPLDGCFRLGFIFGDRAAAAVEASELPDEIKDELRNARKYAEGRGLTIVVNSKEDLKSVNTLVQIKLKY